jgi:hypothetical protein
VLPFDFVGNELDDEESWDDWEREGREMSVEDEDKAWLNQPESRVGRSPIRVVDDGIDNLRVSSVRCLRWVVLIVSVGAGWSRGSRRWHRLNDHRQLVH